MYKNFAHLTVVLAIVLLAACGSQQRQAASEPASPAVKDGGPAQPVNMLSAPEPIPVQEPISESGNHSPYIVNGVTYRVRTGAKGYHARGKASWYGTKFHGRRTANGEVYNMYAMSAAHKTLPLPSYARVTNLDNGRSVIVRVNDRGPFVPGRIIDLSYTAAQKLGYIDEGVARVEVVALDPATLPQASDTLVMRRDAAARQNAARDASFKLPSNTYLQVGAFGSAVKAERVRKGLAAELDYPVTVSPVESGGKKLYRVRIGPLEQQRALVVVREAVEQKQLGAPHVVYD